MLLPEFIGEHPRHQLLEDVTDKTPFWRLWQFGQSHWIQRLQGLKQATGCHSRPQRLTAGPTWQAQRPFDETAMLGNSLLLLEQSPGNLNLREPTPTLLGNQPGEHR
jgi:hypothetical protein